MRLATEDPLGVEPADAMQQSILIRELRCKPLRIVKALCGAVELILNEILAQAQAPVLKVLTRPMPLAALIGAPEAGPALGVKDFVEAFKALLTQEPTLNKRSVGKAMFKRIGRVHHLAS